MLDHWRIEERRGSAAELHDAWPSVAASPEDRAVAVCRPTRSAVVLGSTQSPEVVDRRLAAEIGIDVVHRRSGGGAVLVTPDDPVWIDVWVPSGDPRWDADVTTAFDWLGATWASALEQIGLAGVGVQSGRPADRTRWSSLICFGGVGAGEVTVSGRKVVGLSQRRNRAGAWFHGACVLHWDPRLLVDLLRITGDERRLASVSLSQAVTGVADEMASQGGIRQMAAADAAAAVAAAVAAAFIDTLP